MSHITKLLQLCLPCPVCGSAPSYDGNTIECPAGHLSVKAKDSKKLYSSDKREAYYERCLLSSIWNGKVKAKLPKIYTTGATPIKVPTAVDMELKSLARQCPHCNSKPKLVDIEGNVVLKCEVCSRMSPVVTHMTVKDFLAMDMTDMDAVRDTLTMFNSFWSYHIERFPDGEVSYRSENSSYADYTPYRGGYRDLSEEGSRIRLGFYRTYGTNWYE